MRHIFLLTLLFVTLSLKGQVFYNYSDTIDNFSIDIPTGWRYGINKSFPSLKLVAYYQSTDTSDHIRDNFNLNIFKSSAGTTEKAFSIALESMRSTKNFKLIDSGNINIKGKDFKWLIETHENQLAKINMHNYVFVTFQNNKTYILTTVALSDNFFISKELFYKIAISLDLKE